MGTYEGGVRVPGIAWMPGQIDQGRVSRGIGSTLDILPTIASLVDVDLPTDRYYDGVSTYKWLFEGGSHCNNDYADHDCRNNATETILKEPLLYNLYHDVGERYPVDVTQAYYADIVANVNKSWQNVLSTDGLWGKSQITMGSNNSFAPCCSCDVSNDSWPNCCVCNKINETWPSFKY